MTAPSIEEPERDTAIEKPAGQLDLDVNRRRLPQGRVAEVDLHHSPSAQTGSQWELIQHLGERVANEHAALLLEHAEDAIVGEPREPIGDRITADRQCPDVRTDDQCDADAERERALHRSSLAESQHREYGDARRGNERQRSHVRQIQRGHPGDSRSQAARAHDPTPVPTETKASSPRTIVIMPATAAPPGMSLRPGGRTISRPSAPDVGERMNDVGIQRSGQDAELGRKKALGKVHLQDAEHGSQRAGHEHDPDHAVVSAARCVPTEPSRTRAPRCTPETRPARGPPAVRRLVKKVQQQQHEGHDEPLACCSGRRSPVAWRK